jgi:hypothetical protein
LGFTRRSFLAVSGSAVAACLPLSGSLLSCERSDSSDRERLLVQALRAAYGDPRDAAVIAGRSRWTRERALQLVEQGGPAAGGLLPLDPEALRRRLDARIRRDFAADRTERVDGWLLSQTEVAIAVLVADSAS